MVASWKLDLKGLQKLITKVNSPEIKKEIDLVSSEKAVIALVTQAINDNFAEEGPGWAPLKAGTIRESVNKKTKKQLKNMTKAEILKHEEDRSGTVFRRILVKTGTLKKEAKNPANIQKVDQNLVFRTDLKYAGTHQHGNPKMKIPARPFLNIRDVWKNKIYAYMAKRYNEILKSHFKKG